MRRFVDGQRVIYYYCLRTYFNGFLLYVVVLREIIKNTTVAVVSFQEKHVIEI